MGGMKRRIQDFAVRALGAIALLAKPSRAVAFAAILGSIGSATAQVYPSRPITMIVPFAAGGPTDVIARIVAEHMSHTLGKPLVIENVSGAGGTTGSTRAMRANPDGYTIQIGNVGTHTAAVVLYPNLAYRPDVDFEPISIVPGIAMLIADETEKWAKVVKFAGIKLE
jgi:tripartite-type tricarboxylate transporter receptor subunit TctC